jgi:hypothetical protein
MTSHYVYAKTPKYTNKKNPKSETLLVSSILDKGYLACKYFKTPWLIEM